MVFTYRVQPYWFWIQKTERDRGRGFELCENMALPQKWQELVTLRKQTHEEAARFTSQVYFLKQGFVPQFALTKTGFSRKLVASPWGTPNQNNETQHIKQDRQTEVASLASALAYLYNFLILSVLDNREVVSLKATYTGSPHRHMHKGNQTPNSSDNACQVMFRLWKPSTES